MSSSDGVLWERWRRERDADAFSELVSRHSGMVYATCKRILRNPADAEDVAQDCFLQLLNARVTVRTSLAPWLYTVAIRQSLNKTKSEARRLHRDRQYAPEYDYGAEGPVDDLVEHIDAAIAALSEPLRTPLICHHLEGRSYADIARDLCLPESTVRYRTSKGVGRVRALLDARGITVGAVAITSFLADSAASAATPSLVATLGKLAVAGGSGCAASNAAGGTMTAVVAKWIGGLLVMKKVAACIVVLGILVGGVWTLRKTETVPPSAEPHRIDPTASPEATTAKAVSVDEVERGAVVAPAIEAPPASAGAAEPMGEGIRVAGIVLGQDGQPAAEAHVVAQIGTMDGEETQSSADGTFELTMDRISNELIIQAEKESRESAPVGPLKLRDDGIDGLVLELTVPRTAGVAGIVVDQSGAPVPRLYVDARRFSGVFARQIEPVLTDSRGAFTLTGLAPGRYNLVGSFYARNPETIETVDLHTGQSLTGVRAVLNRGASTISGLVKDTSGAPIADAQVFVHNGFGRTTSDADGHFEIVGLGDGALMIDAVHEKYSWTYAANVAAGTSDLELVMLGKASAEGRVIRADDGEPLDAFSVFQCREADAQNPFQNRQDFRGAEGAFSLHDLDAGVSMVTVLAPDFAPCAQSLTLAEHETAADVEFRLEIGRRAEGSVVNAQGGPIAGARVYLGPFAGSLGSDACVARTDANGRFVIAGLSEDIETISAYHPDYAAASAAVELSAPMRLVMQESGVIEGTVMRSGEPVAGMMVMADSMDGRTAPSIGTTDGDGTFRLDSIVAGTVTVFANVTNMRDGGAQHKTAVVEAGKVTRVDFEFATALGRIEGRVTVDGKAPASAKIVLLGYSGTQAGPQNTDATPEGDFAFEDVAAGESGLNAVITTDDGQKFTRHVQLTIGEGETVHQDLAISLSSNNQISGTVQFLRSDGMLHYIAVFDDTMTLPPISDPAALMQFMRFATSLADCAEDGSYRVVGLDPGRFTVLAIESPKRLSDPNEVRFAVMGVELTGTEPGVADFDFTQ